MRLFKFLYPVVLPFLVVFLNFSPLNSQSLGLQFGVGSTHFLGDLGGKSTIGTDEFSDLDLQTTRIIGTMGLRVNINPRFSLRFSGAYGNITGDDKFTTNKERRTRNLNFYSHIFESSLTMQVNMGASKRIYVFGGIGYFTFNPKTKLNGEVYELQKMGTEGQYVLPNLKPYKLAAVSYPFGVGFKLFSTSTGYFSVEYVFHKSTTDYIDDVSTRFADPVLLAQHNQVAPLLADRSLPGIPNFSSIGNIRGDPTDNDNFSFLTFNYNIILAGSKHSNGFDGSFRIKHGKKKCPDMSY